MYTKKLVMEELLDKDQVVCSDEGVVSILDEGVLVCLDKKDKDDVDVYFIHAHPLEWILE